MNDVISKSINALVESLDVPDSSYDIAAKRYRDLGEWLCDDLKSEASKYIPEVFPQGSFRLGTVVRPLRGDEYDLDLVCNLRRGITTGNISQYSLKTMIRNDLDKYRIERGIEEKPEEKHRCIRLNYQDSLKFHMDTLPGIPHEAATRQYLEERMIKSGLEKDLAHGVSELALAITDDRLSNYREIHHGWLISNPEGYSIWFEWRMRQAHQLLESRAFKENVASIDDLPVYRWKTPLQHVIQILKRHRDIMFEKDSDGKPISVIITTLAARAYGGETDVYSALKAILPRMKSLISTSAPRVFNPVNPSEDFTDKWATPEGQRLQLEQKFLRWLTQANADFEIYISEKDRNSLQEQTIRKFGITLSDKTLTGIFGASVTVPSSPNVQRVTGGTKPWKAL